MRSGLEGERLMKRKEEKKDWPAPHTFVLTRSELRFPVKECGCVVETGDIGIAICGLEG
jgi:hypothetical protein